MYNFVWGNPQFQLAKIPEIVAFETDVDLLVVQWVVAWGLLIIAGKKVSISTESFQTFWQLEQEMASKTFQQSLPVVNRHPLLQQVFDHGGILSHGWHMEHIFPWNKNQTQLLSWFLPAEKRHGHTEARVLVEELGTFYSFHATTKRMSHKIDENEGVNWVSKSRFPRKLPVGNGKYVVWFEQLSEKKNNKKHQLMI